MPARPSRHVLAVDSGGSKCEALLLRDDGTVIGYGRCDVSDPCSGRGSGGSGRSRETLLRAVERAMPAGAELGELHVGGASLRGWLPEGAEVAVPHVVSECGTAFALAGAQSGVMALSGTGALVYGRTPEGREYWVDGLGPLLGDHGSGFQLGLAAIRAAARAHWHPRRATALAGPVTAACQAMGGNPERFSMVEFMLRNPDRAEVASLARLVDEAAAAGDAVAVGILHGGADALAESVLDVVDTLGLFDACLPLVAHGSVATRSRIYWARVSERVARFAPRLQPVVPDLPAVAGVALSVLRDLGAPDTPALRASLRAGLP